MVRKEGRSYCKYQGSTGKEREEWAEAVGCPSEPLQYNIADRCSWVVSHHPIKFYISELLWTLPFVSIKHTYSPHRSWRLHIVYRDDTRWICYILLAVTWFSLQIPVSNDLLLLAQEKRSGEWCQLALLAALQFVFQLVLSALNRFKKSFKVWNLLSKGGIIITCALKELHGEFFTKITWSRMKKNICLYPFIQKHRSGRNLQNARQLWHVVAHIYQPSS